MNAVVTVPTSISAATGLRVIVPHARLLSTSQIIRRLFRMGILFLAARMLGVETFGSYVLLLTVVEMVAVISGCGYMDFLTREIAQHPNSAWTLGRRMTELRLMLIAPSLGLAVLILAGLRFPYALLINAALLGITLVPRAILESAQGTMKGARRFAPLPWIEFAQGAVVLGVAPLLILRGLGLRGLIAAEILGASCAAVISIAVLARSPELGSSHAPSLRQLFRSAFPFNIYPFLTNIYDRVDVVLLSKLAGNFATGIYSLPYRAFATLQIIPYGVMGALLPVLSNTQSKREASEIAARVLKLLLLAALLLVLVTLTIAGPAVRLLLGPAYAGSIPVIEVLIWATVPAFLNFALNTLLVASGREKVFLWTTTTCCIFNIGANLIFIPRYSFMAAAVVTVLTECLLLAQNLWIVRRAVGHVVFPRDGLKIAAVFALVLAAFWLSSRAVGQTLAGLLALSVFLLSVFRFEPGLRVLAIEAAAEPGK